MKEVVERAARSWLQQAAGAEELAGDGGRRETQIGSFASPSAKREVEGEEKVAAAKFEEEKGSGVRSDGPLPCPLP